MSSADLCAIVQERVGAGPGCCNLGSFRSVTAQLASTIVCFAGLGRCPSLGCRYGTGKRKLKRKFTGLSLWTYRQAGKQLERLAKVCSGLGHRRTLDRQAPSLVPILDCLFNEASHRTMLRHKLGLSRCNLGKLAFQRGHSASMQLLPSTAQQGAVRGVLHQRVLKGVRGIRRRPTPEHQLGAYELL